MHRRVWHQTIHLIMTLCNTIKRCAAAVATPFSHESHNSDSCYLQLWLAEKHFRTQMMLNLKVDELQQQKIMSGSSPVSQEQKPEAAVGTALPERDRTDLMNLDSSGGSRWLGCLNAKADLSHVADHLHPFMAKVYHLLMVNLQHDDASCHKGKVVSNWFQAHDNGFRVLQWPASSWIYATNNWGCLREKGRPYSVSVWCS